MLEDSTIRGQVIMIIVPRGGHGQAQNWTLRIFPGSNVEKVRMRGTPVNASTSGYGLI